MEDVEIELEVDVEEAHATHEALVEEIQREYADRRYVASKDTIAHGPTRRPGPVRFVFDPIYR